jgi:hypothetical protein
MDAFFEHHQENSRFRYQCFDRILLNGLIQPFQQPEQVVGFFGTYRQQYPVSRNLLRGMPSSSRAGSRTARSSGVRPPPRPVARPGSRLHQGLLESVHR